MTDPARPREFARIDALRDIFRAPLDAVVGIGDDAAVLAPHSDSGVYTVDASIEDVHFVRAWLSPYDIGFRAFMAAASDVAAMGGRATHALCAWTLPEGLREEALRELALGTEAASLACDAPVVGGNLARARALTLTTTVLGRVAGAPLTRGNGHAGQGLYVTGVLGAARVGLAQLCRDPDADGSFVQAFKQPRARFDVVEELRSIASCAIDLSDGLLPDLSHVCRASQLGARIELSALPRLAGHEATCASLELDAHDALLAGGEEYELLFAAESGLCLGWATQIGELLPAPHSIEVRAADGSLHPAPEGFVHFH